LKRSLFAAALAGIALVPFAAYAQQAATKPVQFGVSGGASLPTSDLSDISNTGWNVSGHVAFNPAMIPLGIRVDGGYSRFGFKQGVDGDIHFGNVTGNLIYKIPATTVSPYLLGGAGWYDQQNSYRQLTFSNGQVCGLLSCTNAVSQTSSLVGRTSTGMRFEKNAGVGVEFAIGDRASFFVDARYMRFSPSEAKLDFIPIRFGVRY